MGSSVATKNFVKSMVPISRFNKGEAGKIFSEVNNEGIKVVLKNNAPTCVLLSPDVYEEMQEALENYRLLLEAETRMERACEDDFITEEQAMKELNIGEDELKDTNVDG
ncbi:MAG: type II toxin-antitoxin system Phd/YefM family antitoxin [Bacillota bacterium]